MAAFFHCCLLAPIAALFPDGLQPAAMAHVIISCISFSHHIVFLCRCSLCDVLALALPPYHLVHSSLSLQLAPVSTLPFAPPPPTPPPLVAAMLAGRATEHLHDQKEHWPIAGSSLLHPWHLRCFCYPS